MLDNDADNLKGPALPSGTNHQNEELFFKFLKLHSCVDSC